MEISGNICYSPAECYYSLFGSSPGLHLLQGPADGQPFSFVAHDDIPLCKNPSTFDSMCLRALHMSDHCKRNVAVDEASEQKKVVVSIPHDVMLEIFSKLPAKYILRLRCVCKLWNSVMQEHYFITRHLNSTPNAYDFRIVALCRPPKPLLTDSYFPSIHHFSNGHYKFNLTGLESNINVIDSFKLSNSCNGLVCVYHNHIICVVNPSIREVLVLPLMSDTFYSWGIAIGQYSSTGEYKIVRHCGHADSKTTTTSVGCAVFNLGSQAWRIIQAAPTVVHDKTQPISANGAIYWLSHHISEAKLVSFDIKNEGFDVVVPPAEFIRNETTILFEMEGNLCLSTVQGTGEYITLLVLEDYNNRRWRTHVINTIQIRKSVKSSLMVPVLVRNGLVLWRAALNRFSYSCLRSGRFSDTLLTDYEYENVCPYKESLISPLALQEKNMRIGFPEWATLRKDQFWPFF